MHLSGSPFDFAVAFFAGFLASLTPCVYPLIPISAGYIAGNAQNSRKNGFILSLFYVTGVSITYSLLGVLAVFTGSLFGRISLNPVVNIAAGLVILIFGLFMFDLFSLDMGFKFKLTGIKRGGKFSSLLLGLVSGLMISPCLSPILGSILAYLATQKSMLYGALLLVSFSYGMGLLFVLVGTFGAGIAALPKSGKWTLVVKRICASAIVLSGVFFIFRAIGRL
ncbi:MAG: cytochrome c biogenesis protein CcdA [Candidatus Omnitrophica bacterium]|nr:cytochrome c biogenesis protein CcdA [Candidatus Omnitrophota bacterium]MDD5042729.1 cytochrome c biogenesis protein CcdA [Candidatus Omnitrophota bacterium]MDD5500759.1 cytochrome c biogenesis protein CcdA [Candidatus Omnitrophota bacterium]